MSKCLLYVTCPMFLTLLGDKVVISGSFSMASAEQIVMSLIPCVSIDDNNVDGPVNVGGGGVGLLLEEIN